VDLTLEHEDHRLSSGGTKKPTEHDRVACSDHSARLIPFGFLMVL
jgi:hypothetical protein